MPYMCDHQNAAFLPPRRDLFWRPILQLERTVLSCMEHYAEFSQGRRTTTAQYTGQWGDPWQQQLM